jgi:ribosome-associated protein
MTPEELKYRSLEREFIFSTSRSSGPGGQNVNKVSTRVELRFNLPGTSLFTEEEKLIIYKKLKNKINKELQLVLVSQEARTQTSNKKIVTGKFYKIVSKALTLQETRKPTRPTLASKLRRLESKSSRSSIKRLRRQKETPE